MATADQVAELRRKVSEPDTTTYSDQQLSDKIDSMGSVDAAASDIWSEKAGMYAEMTDISEAGSSRKNSQLYKAALEMAQYYGAQTEEQLVQPPTRPSTRRIVRA